jgi:hypothetical protein
MRNTIQRPPAGSDRPHDLDFLEGIDLEKAHRRRSRARTTWIVVGIAVLAVLGAVVVALLVGGEGEAPERALPTLEEREIVAARPRETDLIIPDYYGLEVPTAELTARELGRDPGPTARPRETDVIVLDHYGLSEAGAASAPVPKVNPGEMIPQ